MAFFNLNPGFMPVPQSGGGFLSGLAAGAGRQDAMQQEAQQSALDRTFRADQANQNRTFQGDQANLDRTQRQGISDAELKLRQIALQQQEAAANRSYGLQMQSFNQAKVPPGFRVTENGGLQAIPGGPADPAYLNQAKAPANPVTVGEGQSLVNPSTGQVVFQGGPKPLTEGQANSSMFADRATLAEPNLADPKNAAAAQSTWNKIASNIPLVGNMMVSEDAQQFDQSKRDFINALLRKESGAVIGTEEFASADKQYFPQPGDSPSVIAQKEANRTTAIQGLQRAAGPAYRPPTGGAPTPDAPRQVRDGMTATNPKTGEKVVLRNGKWEPVNGQTP